VGKIQQCYKTGGGGKGIQGENPVTIRKNTFQSNRGEKTGLAFRGGRGHTGRQKKKDVGREVVRKKKMGGESSEKHQEAKTSNYYHCAYCPYRDGKEEGIGDRH